jgi:hypothetical protein
VVYDSSTVGSEFFDDYIGINSFLLELSGSVIYINLAFLTPLTTPGIDALVPLGDGSPGYTSFDCNPNCNYARLIVSGEAVSVVPTPIAGAGLPGVGTVLALGGFVWWRRKQGTGPFPSVYPEFSKGATFKFKKDQDPAPTKDNSTTTLWNSEN